MQGSHEFRFRKGRHLYVYRFGDSTDDHDAMVEAFYSQAHDPRLNLDTKDLARLCRVILEAARYNSNH